MRNPGGFATITSPVSTRIALDGLRCEEMGAGILEIDTFSCIHCNRVIHTKAKTQADEYFCRNCMARICPSCADHPCTPFLKKIEQQESRDRMLRGIING